MPNVLIDRDKLDVLANAISAKSGEALTLTLDEMVDAVDGIETGGGGITPTGNIDITSAGVTDVTNYATATVAEGEMFATAIHEYYTENGVRKWRYRGQARINTNDGDGTPGYIANQTNVYGTWVERNAIAKNTSVTPTESSQTIGGANVMMEGAVTVNAIPSNYVGSAITSRTSSDLSASGATVTAPAGYYSSAASKSIASGSATPAASLSATGASLSTGNGTLTLTKNNVSNTPQVTAGYVASGTAGNTNMSLTATVTTQGATTYYPTTSDQTISGSRYLTGTQTIKAVSQTNLSAENIKSGTTISITNGSSNIWSVTGTYSGGGGSGMIVATASSTLTAASASISFTGLSGEPTSFVICSAGDLATGSTPYKAAAVVFDGTNVIGQTITSQVTYDSSGFSKSYSAGTLTVTGSAYFQANEYKLVYTYGGSSANLGTADVQVGSGATSITFTGLTDEPDYFSLIFKSDFSTSSGYQRVITVVYDGTSTYGLAMDSGAKAQTSWSYTYNAGTLVISSTGTNDGGYFHQPGYYQLTFGYGGEPTPITVEALTVTTNGTYTAPTGKAYSPVNVNVSGGGIGDLLGTTAIGAYSTAVTSATNMNISTAATNINGYDVLIVETSVNSAVANRHTATVGLVFLTNSTDISTKNASAIATVKWNSKLSSSNITQTTSSTTAYGIYPNSCTITTASNGTATFPMYARYNSSRTGTINGTYTTRIYGVKLVDLIGG